MKPLTWQSESGARLPDLSLRVKVGSRTRIVPIPDPRRPLRIQTPSFPQTDSRKLVRSTPSDAKIKDWLVSILGDRNRESIWSRLTCHEQSHL